MNNAEDPSCKTRNIHRGVPEYLESEGFSEMAVDALLRFDLSAFRWRRMAEKGEFKGKVLEDLSETLEPALLQGLISVAQIAGGVDGSAPTPPTIGLVADRMSVDPSRASRIVAELVTRGYVERQAAQDDARKSVLVMTPKAYAFLKEFSAAKWRILGRVFEGWESSEIDAFATLFHRYVDGIEQELRGGS